MNFVINLLILKDLQFDICYSLYIYQNSLLQACENNNKHSQASKIKP